MFIVRTAKDVLTALSFIKGGYHYEGAASSQICFPLKGGGELRFGVYDDDPEDVEFCIDLYDGLLPPCISGPSTKTGQ